MGTLVDIRLILSSSTIAGRRPIRRLDDTGVA
jgi:hypothetical protein